MESTSWLCLDGPIFPNWSDNFNTIIDSEFLQLKNGDRLMTQSKFVFETSSLADASPSIVSKSGIVFYGEDLVGWRSIAKSWLDLRKSLESQVVNKFILKTLHTTPSLTRRDNKKRSF